MKAVRSLGSSLSDRWNTVFWFLLSTAILGGLVYVSDYRALLDELSGSDTGYVVGSIACGCFTLLVWSVVWHRFFILVDINIRFRQSLRLLLAGTFLNSVTPLGRFGGEPFIAHLIARRTDATFQQAFSSVSSADLSNAFPFVTFGGMALAYVAAIGTFQHLVADLAVLIIVLLLAAVLTVYLLWFGGAQRLGAHVGEIGLPAWFGRFQPHVAGAWARIQETLSRMRDIGDHPRAVLVTLGISHLAVLGHIGAVYFVLLAVDVDPVPQTMVLVVALSSFLTFSPTPGSTGTFEAGFAGLAVVFFSVAAPTATSIAILYRVGTYLPGIVLGYGSLVSLGRSPTPDSSG